MPKEVSSPDVKDALKEALREWLDEKFAEVGKWTAGALAAVALSAIVYGIISLAGYHK